MALSVTQLSGFGAGSGSPFLYDIIRELGLTTNLVGCWDVADLSCYSGSGDNWVDRVDPVNNIWERGQGTAAAKPTFNGVAGVPTESTYWSFDGGDYFGEPGTNMTFADDWHKNNGTFSFVYGMYVINGADIQVLFTSDAFGGALNTMAIDLNNAERLGIEFNDSTAYTANDLCTPSSWNILCGSYSEASTNVDWNVNGLASSDTTSTKSSGAAPGDTYQLMSNNAGGGAFIVPNGTRLAFVAFWNTAIGASAMSSLRSTLKARRLPSAP